MSMNRSMAKGAAWMVSLRMFHRGVGFISTLILARLLVPEDFGLVAMAMVLLEMLVAVSDFSVHVLLIQKAEIDRDDMDSAWSLQILVGVAQAVLLVALAHPASLFYDEPRLVPIVLVLAVVALLRGVKNIGVVMFQREMTFHRDFMLMAIQRLTMFVVTVTAAIIFRSYWALVAGMLAGAITECGLSYAMHSHRPRWCRSRWGEVIGFSRWLLLNNLLYFLGRRGPELILGRLLGARAVGLFSVGFDIAMLPTTELVAPINRATLPGYSRLRETEGGLQRGYLDVIGLIAIVAVPAAVGIAATAEWLIPVLLGEKWRALIPIVHSLALAGAVGVLLTNTGSVFMALGRPWVMTWVAALRIALLLPTIYLAAVYHGVAGVALAYLGVAVVVAMVNLGLVLGALQASVSRFLAAVWRPIVAAAVMYTTVRMIVGPLLAGQAWTADWSIAVIAIIVGAAVYLAGVLVLWRLAGLGSGAERRVFQLFGEALQPRMPALGQWLQARGSGDHGSA